MAKQAPSDKRRVIVDYKNITAGIMEMFSERYPYGYENEDVIKFKNAKGEMVRAVPFETPDTKYLVKISVEMDAKIDAFLDEDEEDPELAPDKDLESPENLED